jgi:hypothetical protein
VIRYDSTVIRCDTLFFRFKRKNISLNGRITAYHCRIIAYHKRITSVSQRITNTSQQFDTPTFRAGATLLTVLARGSAEGVPGAATLLTVLARGSAQAVPWAVSVLTVTTIHESLKAVSENAVDGELLCSLDRNDLINELGLTPLQAAKVLQRLR